jgi:hypothetical protein
MVMRQVSGLLVLSLSTQDREIKVPPAEHKAPHRRLHPPLLPLKTSVVGDNGSYPCSNRELEFNGRKPGSHRFTAEPYRP